MSAELIDFWVITCTTEGCVAQGQDYQTNSENIECGGCNTVYEKPEVIES